MFDFQEDIKKYKESEYNDIQVKIKSFTNYAWASVYSGFVILVIGVVFYFFDFHCGDEYFSLNLLGDFLGGTLASVWSLAGIFFLYVAFLGQKLQLINQQREIQLTVREIRAQREEMEFQSKTFEKQQFENTLFNLLRMHHQIVSGVKFSEKVKGVEAFKFLKENFEENFESTYSSIESVYNSFFSYYKQNLRTELDHYFNNFDQIVRFILGNNLVKADQDRRMVNYLEIYFSQISYFELVLIQFWVLGKENEIPISDR